MDICIGDLMISDSFADHVEMSEFGLSIASMSSMHI